MRLRFILPLLVAGFSSLGGAAQAQSSSGYPWCALQADKAGAMTCYFSSQEQCRVALGGIGGSCVRNPAYRGH